MMWFIRVSFHLFLVLIIGLLPGCKKEDPVPVDGDGNSYNTVVIGTQKWQRKI